MAVNDATCRVICGDCRDLLPEVVAGVENPVIVSDPPFNVGYHSRASTTVLTSATTGT